MIRITGFFQKERLTLALAAALALAFATSSLQAEDFSKARRGLVAKLKHRDSVTRISALQELAKHSHPDAARTILEHGSGDRVPEVRDAALKALLAINDEPAVCTALKDYLTAGDRARPVAAVEHALLALALSSHAEAQTDLIALLDADLNHGGRLIEAAVRALEYLANQGDEAALRATLAFAKSTAFKGSIAFHEAVIAALTKNRAPDRVDELVNLLPEMTSGPRAAAVAHLERTTGQRFGDNAGAWRSWCQGRNRNAARGNAVANASAAGSATATGDTSTSGGASGAASGGATGSGTGEASGSTGATASADGTSSGDTSTSGDRPSQVTKPTYFGLEIGEGRVVFVVDISGSMAGTKMQAVKRELSKAIKELPNETAFDVVFFSDVIRRWKGKLIAASELNKIEARKYVEAVNPKGATITYDALETALQYKAEAIYFLSDGNPTKGRYINPNDIRRGILELNPEPKVKIHCIGFQPGSEGSRFVEFLRGLAGENDGEYMQVDY